VALKECRTQRALPSFNPSEKIQTNIEPQRSELVPPLPLDPAAQPLTLGNGGGCGLTGRLAQVSNTDAMQLLRRVLALRKQGGSSTAPASEPEGQAGMDSTSTPAEGAAALPPSLADPADLSIESVEAENPEEALTVTPPAVPAPQIQAGCTAVVAVFQVSPPLILFINVVSVLKLTAIIRILLYDMRSPLTAMCGAKQG
jgi:hypothetical protein